MNKSFLKFIADFGPLLIFFTIYYKSGNNLSVAIPPLIISTIIAVAAIYFLEKKQLEKLLAIQFGRDFIPNIRLMTILMNFNKKIII